MTPIPARETCPSPERPPQRRGRGRSPLRDRRWRAATSTSSRPIAGPRRERRAHTGEQKWIDPTPWVSCDAVVAGRPASGRRGRSIASPRFRRAATITSKTETGARRFLRDHRPETPELRRPRDAPTSHRDRLGAEDLAGRRVGGETCGEVERRPEVAPIELDDPTAMDPEPKQREQRLTLSRRTQVDGRPHGTHRPGATMRTASPTRSASRAAG